MIQVPRGCPGFHFNLLLCQLAVVYGHQFSLWILVLEHLLLKIRLRRICILEHLVYLVPQV